ncbi:hypothetical protein SAMN04490244_104372 [Tranquillimonas rosea]|uniref:Lipoprotein n=1 Tax=Tranquillimonas rosea TaxID=641238 RepID=A0A1H9TU85_9RHOB|nr:hypothetical protein [Tranquillimonas rosea]SES00552.1 hypothetical protein SAMN04490244_104372 [Tranquillimonas rosea]
MTLIKFGAALALAGALAACDGTKVDQSIDRGLDSKDLSQLKGGIWIDPNGCDHWRIDDGIEGYQGVRLDRDGKPVCSGAGAPNTVVGPYHSGSPVADPM